MAGKAAAAGARAPSLPMNLADEGRPMSNGCETVAAMDRQTAAIERQTNAYEANSAKLDQVMSVINAGVEAFKPAADEIRDLGQAQKKLCAFLVGNRLKIVGGLIGSLVAVGAISPTAANGLSQLLKVWGGQ